MKSFFTKKEALNFLIILLGCVIASLGIVGLLTPNKIATGGTAGLAIVLNYLLDLPVGLILFIINVPLLFVSAKYLGKRFAFKTVFALIFLSGFIDFLNGYVHLPVFSESLMLSTIYGGLTTGIGIGLIFKGGASAGGGTIIAKIICSRTTLKPGDIILFIDTCVVILAAIAFKNLELGLWSTISIYVSSKFVDLVVTGRIQNKVVHISCENIEELNLKITTEMNINGTVIQGGDLENNQSRKIIFLSINKNRIISLRNLVESYDPKAYLIVFEASELLNGRR